MAKIELVDDGSVHSEEQAQDQFESEEPDSIPSTKRKHNANRINQKALLRERKSRRLHSNVIMAARVAWGSESIKCVPAEERINRVEAVLLEISSLISQICLKHDVSRLVQSCIKYGNDTQRGIIADGIKGHVLELCMNQYGYHVILKMLRYGSRSIQSSIVDELRGNIARLCQHRVAFKIIDLAWRSTCNINQKNDIMFEFYGKEHGLFRDISKPVPSMSELLKSLDEKKRQTLLDEVRIFLDKCITKGTMQLSLFHTLLRLYLENVTNREPLIESLKEHTLQICATLDGVIATCIMLDYSSPKLRKAIIKSWKGQVVTMAKDSDGYLAVAKALTIIDDAVMLQKCIINELLPEVCDLMQSLAGSKVLLQVAAPGQARYFTIAERDILKTVESMSKKSEEVRRIDNLKHFIPAMISALKDNFLLACTMLRDRSLSGLFESCLQCAMGLSDEVCDAARDYIKTLVLYLSQEEVTDLDEKHIVAHPVAHRVFKSLCASSQSLMHPVFTDFCLTHMSAILRSRAVWILVPLVESLPDVRASVKMALKKVDCSTVPGLKKLKELCKE